MVSPKSDSSENGDYSVFQLGDFKLKSGTVLPNAFVAYQTYGTPSKPCIVYPTWYSGTPRENEWLIGTDKSALNPNNYFIVIPNMLANGLSSSPSNQAAPFDGPRFPKVTIWDSVAAQHKLITEGLGIQKLFAVVGWSMGGAQSYQWAAQYPDMVERIAPFCASAKTSPHNIVFLEGPKAALTADAAFKEGEYKSAPEKGLRAFGRVYAGWGFSQAFYRQRLYDTVLGFKDLDHFLVGFWEPLFLQRDANNLLCMLRAWQRGDISDNSMYNGNFHAALAAIKAKTLIMPGSTDLYFHPDDNLAELKHLKHGKLAMIETVWGHWAGAPGNPVDAPFIDRTLAKFFAE
ncbi:hypothetical protein HDU89_005106 [Geranomyces variabilis]|nr:hypothetical protein HDU89_005106 [Geranomyces variabilis]